jgi:peroxiredoxin family protein
MDAPLNLVLFSGTDDKLQAAAVLTAGAAALGKPVNVFLQYWALDAFRTDRIERDHGLAPEAGEDGRLAVDALRAAGRPPPLHSERPKPGRSYASSHRSKPTTPECVADRYSGKSLGRCAEAHIAAGSARNKTMSLPQAYGSEPYSEAQIE